MAKITREQFNKWSAQLPEGWKLDLQHYVMWGEKKIYTDAPADEAGTFYRLELRYREETNGRGWSAEKTGYQLPRVCVDRWNKTQNEGMYTVIEVYAEIVGEKQKKRNYSYLAQLAAEIDAGSFFAKAAEKDTGRTWYTIGQEPEEVNAETPSEDATETGKAPAQVEPEEVTTEDAQEPEEDATETGEAPAQVEPEEAATEPEEDTAETPSEPEEVTTEDATEDATENANETGEASTARGYSFAELAAAYIAGRTVKAKPRPQAKPSEQTKQEPTPEAVQPPTPEPEEQTQEAAAPGYHANDNERLTDEQREALEAGEVVIKGKSYSRRAYFSANYIEGVKLVYSAYAGDERDRINPGGAADYYGFMVGADLYTDTKAIGEKMREDINARLLRLVPDEETAASMAANVSEWEAKRIEESKTWDYTREARDLFYKGGAPALVLYSNTPADIRDMIEYIREPERVIELYALEYLSDYPENICQSWIRYNRVRAAYNAIVNDPTREEHELKRIAHAVDEQKTVRVLLECGEEVRVEALAIKGLTHNSSIYGSWIIAADRYKLNDERGRCRDIKSTEIVRISHGNRVLYQRAAKLEKQSA